MKRLLILIVISILIFNWIGYQFYRAMNEENTNQAFTADTDQIAVQRASSVGDKIPGFHMIFFVKDVDFDDLFEFTATPNNSVNEIYFNIQKDLFFNHAGKENKLISFMCFNGEYYSRPDKLFTKYPDVYSSGKIPDRYLMKIPIVFLSPKDHPPQLIA